MDSAANANTRPGNMPILPQLSSLGKGNTGRRKGWKNGALAQRRYAFPFAGMPSLSSCSKTFRMLYYRLWFLSINNLFLRKVVFFVKKIACSCYGFVPDAGMHHRAGRW